MCNRDMNPMQTKEMQPTYTTTGINEWRQTQSATNAGRAGGRHQCQVSGGRKAGGRAGGVWSA